MFSTGQEKWAKVPEKWKNFEARPFAGDDIIFMGRDSDGDDVWELQSHSATKVTRETHGVAGRRA